MAVSVRAVASNAHQSNQLTISKPTGTVDGDLMVAFVSFDNTPAPSDPGGWTSLDTESTSSISAVFYKIASSEGSSYNFGGDNISPKAGGIITFTGHNTSNPIDVHSVNTDGSADTTATGTAVTPTIAPGVLLALFVATDNDIDTSGYAIANNNPTWTEQFDVKNTTSGAASAAAATGSYDFVSTTGAPTATLSGSQDCAVYLVAVRPSDPVISAPLGTLTVTAQTPAVTPAVSVTPPAAAIDVDGGGDASQASPDWSNTSKNSASPSNTTKNTISPTNTAKSSTPSWLNTNKS